MTTLSYDISFKVKVEGIDRYVEVGDCDANTTWNVREMIVKSTGLEWKNEDNNGLVKDVMPFIYRGYAQLLKFPEIYKKYESPNGWGTVESTRDFFKTIIESWEAFCKWENEDLIDVATFWIQ